MEVNDRTSSWRTWRPWARATLLSALGAGPDDDSASLVLHMPALLSALLEKAEEAVDGDELVVA